MIIRTYSELITLHTFDERFKYLQLCGTVGKETFGFDRYLNQMLYKLNEWQHIRRDAIVRDNGRDLGCEGFDIYGRILVHHLNPITVDDIQQRNPKIFDLENLISTTHTTHNAIHYGNDKSLIRGPIERNKNDTCPWRH